MNPDQRALLNNIIANPEDDVARLVYADWLEEFGTIEDQAYAAMIRDQIARPLHTYGKREVYRPGMLSFWILLYFMVFAIAT